MYRVTWAPEVARAIEGWVEDLDEDESFPIVDAISRIDRRLQTDPEMQGESRDLGRRFLYEEPLGITFLVDSDASTVWVLRAWRVRRT